MKAVGRKGFLHRPVSITHATWIDAFSELIRRYYHKANCVTECVCLHKKKEKSLQALWWQQRPCLYSFKTQHPVWVNKSVFAHATTILFGLERQLCWDQQFGAIVQTTSPSGYKSVINVRYQMWTFNLSRMRFCPANGKILITGWLFKIV